ISFSDCACRSGQWGTTGRSSAFCTTAAYMLLRGSCDAREKFCSGQPADQKPFVMARQAADQLALRALPSQHFAAQLDESLVRLPAIGRRSDGDFEGATVLAHDHVLAGAGLGTDRQDAAVGMCGDVDH